MIGQCIYQIRTRGGEWIEVDEQDYRRLQGMHCFDFRILTVTEELVIG